MLLLFQFDASTNSVSGGETLCRGGRGGGWGGGGNASILVQNNIAPHIVGICVGVYECAISHERSCNRILHTHAHLPVLFLIRCKHQGLVLRCCTLQNVRKQGNVFHSGETLHEQGVGAREEEDGGVGRLVEDGGRVGGGRMRRSRHSGVKAARIGGLDGM